MTTSFSAAALRESTTSLHPVTAAAGARVGALTTISIASKVTSAGNVRELNQIQVDQPSQPAVTTTAPAAATVAALPGSGWTVSGRTITAAGGAPCTSTRTPAVATATLAPRATDHNTNSLASVHANTTNNDRLPWERFAARPVGARPRCHATPLHEYERVL